MKKLYILTFLSIFSCLAEALIITDPGLYAPNSITFTPTAADVIIRISSSNVTLDLANVLLTQSGGGAFTLNGIEIDSGLENVTIINGIVEGITGRAVVVGAGCTNIRIENMLCDDCELGGIQFNGSVGSEILDSVVRKLEIVECAQNTGSNGLEFTSCQKLIVDNCGVNNSGNTSTTFTAVSLDTCSDVSFSNIETLENDGAFITCFNIIDTDRSVFENCVCSNNNAVASTGFLGFNLEGSGANPTEYNFFTGCQALDNSASTATAVGFNLLTNVQNNVFTQCIASGQTGDDAIGYFLGGAGTLGSYDNLNNVFISCFAYAQTAASGDAEGWLIESSDFGIIDRCRSAFQDGSAGTSGSGIRVVADGGDEWALFDSYTFRSVGPATGSSFGIRDQLTGTTTFLYIRDISFNNGTGGVTTQQLSGVPAGSVMIGSTTSMNGLFLDFSSVGVAS